MQSIFSTKSEPNSLFIMQSKSKCPAKLLEWSYEKKTDMISTRDCTNRAIFRGREVTSFAASTEVDGLVGLILDCKSFLVYHMLTKEVVMQIKFKQN